jgi:hypothetical protein
MTFTKFLVTVIERLDLRERIANLGRVRRTLSEQADRQADRNQADRNQADRNNGYDSSLAHAIKRLDQTIGYLWNLDATGDA